MSEKKVLKELIESIALVNKFLNNDVKKTILWFETENELLGGTSPLNLMLYRGPKKLLKFIKTQLSENREV